MATDKSSDPVEKALQEVARIQDPDKSLEAVIKEYDNWSSYDEAQRVMDAKGHYVVSAAVLKYLPYSKDVRVLDVAAGTGLVGEQLKAHGFNNIDALDASEGMLHLARQRNIYKNCIQEFFPSESPSIVKTSSYDVVVSNGGISVAHMNCDCLPEMIRCVKTGGLVVIAFAEKHLTNVAEYKDRLEPLMRQLEADGQWQMLERTVIPNFYHTNNGLLFAFKVTKLDK